MATIISINVPSKKLTPEQWIQYGRYCNRGVYFDEMYKPGINYILEVDQPNRVPQEFYKGFFEKLISKYGRGIFNYINQRTWDPKRNYYVDYEWYNGFHDFTTKGINKIINENIQKLNEQST